MSLFFQLILSIKIQTSHLKYQFLHTFSLVIKLNFLSLIFLILIIVLTFLFLCGFLLIIDFFLAKFITIKYLNWIFISLFIIIMMIMSINCFVMVHWFTLTIFIFCLLFLLIIFLDYSIHSLKHLHFQISLHLHKQYFLFPWLVMRISTCCKLHWNYNLQQKCLLS